MEPNLAVVLPEYLTLLISKPAKICSTGPQVSNLPGGVCVRSTNSACLIQLRSVNPMTHRKPAHGQSRSITQLDPLKGNLPLMRFRVLSSHKLLFLFVAVTSVLAFGVSSAGAQATQDAVKQTSSVTPRIVEAVDESRLTKLSGNVPMLAKSQFDRGEIVSSTQLTHIRLVLSRSPEQEAALDKFQTELQDKSSPNYHKWLTPEQFGKLYGPSDSDISAIVAWLESHGLKLEEVSKGRTNIAFSGTAGQVEEAFHTRIHSFEANGRQFNSNTTDPSIPSALAPVVIGISHLNTIRPLPHHIAGPTGTINHETQRLMPVRDAKSTLPRADFTGGSGTADDPYFLYIVPGDAATIYDTPNSTFNANYTGTNYTGSGVTIGIGGDAAILASTVVNFRTKFLGNSTPPTITNVDGVTDTTDTDEAYIDTQLSGGLAPGAAIHFYTSNDLTSGIMQAINDNTVDIFSLSFGLCELELTTSDNTLIASMWQQAFNQGIAVTVSTGDTGSASCDAIDPGDTTAATYGLSVSGYTSTPYNIAVGGTDLYGLSSSFSTYASTASQGSAATFYRTALKYIPESTWNDSSLTDTTISANSPITGFDQNGNPLANIVAGSGGFSNCSTNTNISPDVDAGSCTSGYAKPAWQRGAGFLPDNARDIPDVSLMAGNGFDPATWLVCTDDTGTVGGATVTANCANQSSTDTTFYFLGFGGTSTAAPAFAGILALVEQKVGGRLGGDAAQVLYSLYNSSNAATIFHDTTVGNISVSCVASSPDCVTDTAGFPYESGYNASAGYDLATGMGSVDVKQLVNFWGSAVAPATATLKITPSATTILASQSLSVAVLVTGTAGTPSGTVSLSGGGYTSSSVSLSGGAATFTIPAGSLAAGTDTLTVEYSGDSTYGSLSNTANVTVTAPVATLSATSLSFGVTAIGVSAAAKKVTITNTGNSSLTFGTVAITGAGASSFAQSNNCTTVAAAGSCAITVTFTPATVGTFSASISIPDNASNSPQTVALTGTGAVAGPAVGLSPTSLTFAGTPIGASAATQAITLTNTGTSALGVSGFAITGSGSGSFSQINTCGSSVVSGGTCTITVTFTPTALGSLSAALAITDTAGDSPQSVSLSGTGTEAGTYALAASAVSATPGTPATSTITATGSGGYTGPISITLNSCTLATSPTGATDSPTCAITSATVTFASGATTGTGGSVTINSTAASAAVKAARLNRQRSIGRWAGAGGVALAGLLLFGIPARRRKWTSLLGLFFLAIAFTAFSACGGGGGGGGGGNPGTTAGTYTFTISGTDSDGLVVKTTLTVTVS
jgi:subtilase family serine protease